MSSRVNSPLPTEKPLIAAESSECSGPDVCGHPGHSSSGMESYSRRAAAGHSDRTRSSIPAALSRTRLKRTRTVLPPLLSNSHVHQRGSLHGFIRSKELSHSHAGSPFTLGIPERHELSPAVLFPSTLVVDGTKLVGNCKLGRSKVNSPPFHLRAVKDNQMRTRFRRTTTVLPPLSSGSRVHKRGFSTEHDKDNHRNQSYADPVAGAPAPFMRRISELSSLEADTVRQEKRKTRRPREPPP